MSHIPPSSPPHAIFGLFLCLAVVVTLGGCSSSTRLAMDDRPVLQPRPAVRPAQQPAPNFKSALGRPTEPPAQVYTWNGSPNRIAEGPAAPHYTPHAAQLPPPYPAHAAPRHGAPHQQIAAAPYQPPTAAQPSTPVHMPRGSVLVQPGDTLYGLSRRHGVSISALMDANKLTSLTLMPGQVLKLPASTRQRG